MKVGTGEGFTLLSRKKAPNNWDSFDVTVKEKTCSVYGTSKFYKLITITADVFVAYNFCLFLVGEKKKIYAFSLLIKHTAQREYVIFSFEFFHVNRILFPLPPLCQIPEPRTLQIFNFRSSAIILLGYFDSKNICHCAKVLRKLSKRKC